MPKLTLGFALTGSFCTFDKAFAQMEDLIRRGYEILPVLSFRAANTDTRFYLADMVRERVHAITGRLPLCTLPEVEPIGPKKLTDAYVIAPATGSTLARLAAGLFDTPATLGAKSHLRNDRPVILAVSTNDGLGLAAQNIGRLMAYRNFYFVPFAQDDPQRKPRSLVARFELLAPTISAALSGVQLQPMLIGGAPETQPTD